MIWATARAGSVTYVSPDWVHLTGQEATAALDHGWRQAIHADDKAQVMAIFLGAVRAGAAFTVCYRLKRPDETYDWVVSGAVPSVSPVDGAFIGFLGSITKIDVVDPFTQHAHGRLGSFEPPPPHHATMPSTTLDLIADHLLIAHALIVDDGGQSALPHLKAAIFKIGRELAQEHGGGRAH